MRRPMQGRGEGKGMGKRKGKGIHTCIHAYAYISVAERYSLPSNMLHFRSGRLGSRKDSAGYWEFAAAGRMARCVRQKYLAKPGSARFPMPFQCVTFRDQIGTWNLRDDHYFYFPATLRNAVIKSFDLFTSIHPCIYFISFHSFI